MYQYRWVWASLAFTLMVFSQHVEAGSIGLEVGEELVKLNAGPVSALPTANSQFKKPGIFADGALILVEDDVAGMGLLFIKPDTHPKFEGLHTQILAAASSPEDWSWLDDGIAWQPIEAFDPSGLTHASPIVVHANPSHAVFQLFSWGDDGWQVAPVGLSPDVTPMLSNPAIVPLPTALMMGAAGLGIIVLARKRLLGTRRAHS